MVYGRLKAALASEKFEYRSPVDLGIGDAMYRRPVISIYAPSKAHHSPLVWCTPRRFEVISSGSIGLVIHSVTSRLRTLGRAIGSGASTRLASETCCCSLMGRTNTAAPYRRGGAAVDSSSCRGPIPTHRHLAASACAWRYVPVRQPLHAGNFFPRTTVRNFRFSEYR